MTDSPLPIGRVLRSSTTGFTVGCRQLISDQARLVPEFGALVKAVSPGRDLAIYGVISDVLIEDDTFVRQLVAAGIESAEIIEDQRQKRQVPIEVSVVVTGYGRDTEIAHRLPPQPPATLDEVFPCNDAELVRFTERHDWLRTVLGVADAAVDQLLIAVLRAAAAARRPSGQDETYLVDVGRELARLLAVDLARLDGILRQLR